MYSASRTRIGQIIFLSFIVIMCYLLHKYGRQVEREGLNNFESMKPLINTLYKDKRGIEIAELGNYGKCLIIEDEVQLCDKKEYIYHEMIVHFPIMYIKKPVENVVIIGGGDLMTLREIMKYYSIKKVFMLELDETIVTLCEKYFNQSKYEEDSRVEIIYGDANTTINTLLEKYKRAIDFVIVDTTEDNTNNTSVDSKIFFDKCLRLLNPSGVLVKNGVFFKSMFEQDFIHINTISYNVNIPYFQEKYYFTIVSNQQNNIKQTELQINNWNDYEISVKFYNPHKHNKYLIFEEYAETNGSV